MMASSLPHAAPGLRVLFAIALDTTVCGQFRQQDGIVFRGGAEDLSFLSGLRIDSSCRGFHEPVGIRDDEWVVGKGRNDFPGGRKISSGRALLFGLGFESRVL